MNLVDDLNCSATLEGLKLEQMPVCGIEPGAELSRPYHIAKRLCDIVFSLVGIILLSPIFLLVAVGVLLTGGAPVLFTQTRVGRWGKPFTILKFRSMRKDAEKYLKANAELHSKFKEAYKLEKDPRVTKFGSFIRKTSLDELPQLFNVLRGDMSLVGPRPVQFAELEKFGANTSLFLSMLPGCTGLWQCSGRASTTYEERVKMDVEYVTKANLLYDAKLIAKTFVTVIARHGAW